MSGWKEARAFMLSKIKSDKVLGRACVGLPATRVILIRDFIQSDAYRSHEQVRDVFGLHRRQAEVLCLYFRDTSYAGKGVVFGHKAEAYWTEEQMLNEPKYSVDELKGEELEILNTIYHEQREQA